MRQRRVVILAASGGELANQLWNYVSLFAYACERGYRLENPSFFEYGASFAMEPPSHLLKWVFFAPFKGYMKRKQAFRRRAWRKMYGWYASLLAWRHRPTLIRHAATEAAPFYLPPSMESRGQLLRAEQASGDLYFDGWLFRNPVGLERYRSEIRTFIKPRRDILERVERRVEALRAGCAHLVGVHFRQGDYRHWRGGAYALEATRVREILEEYLVATGRDPHATRFVLTSDGPVDLGHFAGLEVMLSGQDAVTDLFLLAATDVVIGSNSTFGAFAAYYGDIPFVVMRRESMDWGYYKGKTRFFENRDSTMVFY
jgi:hypothetical protein